MDLREMRWKLAGHIHVAQDREKCGLLRKLIFEFYER